MPNRIIKDSIWSSPNFNQLSVYAERHFYRLLLLADDWGCFEATPEVVLGKCYPLKLGEIKVEDIKNWHQELNAKGILKFWVQDGRGYAIFVKFDKHNRKYALDNQGKALRHKRKTPEPPEELALLEPDRAKLSSNELKVPILNPNPKPINNPLLESGRDLKSSLKVKTPKNFSFNQPDLAFVKKVIENLDPHSRRNPDALAQKLLSAYGFLLLKWAYAKVPLDAKNRLAYWISVCKAPGKYITGEDERSGNYPSRLEDKANKDSMKSILANLSKHFEFEIEKPEKKNEQKNQ